MLNNDVNTLDTQATETTAAVPAIPAATAVAGLAQFSSPFSQLTHQFYNELGMYIVPSEAVTGCTVIGSSIKFGKQMENDAGDFLLVQPVNVTPYLKCKLGLPNPTEDEKRLQVNCYDGKTVVYDNVTYSKEEYTEMLRTKGYSKVTWDEQGVIHGMYLGCDRSSKVEVKEDDKLFAVYLSKSSYKAWKAFLFKSSISTGAGNLLKLTKETKSWNGVTWTQFSFERAEQG